MIEDLEVVLTSLADDLDGAQADAAELRSAQGDLANEINAVEERLDSLVGQVGRVAPVASTAQDAKLRQRRATRAGPLPWDELVRDATDRLRVRGVDPKTASVDALLDPEEVERIQHRFTAGLHIRARLDPYDIIAAVAAGLVAGAVDFLIVRIPRPIAYLGRPAEGQASVVTQWLHSLDVPSNNWLARHFRTSYDAVASVASDIDGFGPKTHRLQTFGHDPLIGLVIGTIDIMRGGLTAVSRAGEIVSFAGTGDPVPDVIEALFVQIMHLLSDAPTRMGLPPPGWSVLQLLQVGNLGEKERTVADLARDMYLRGYDSRHFLTMSTSCAAAEIVLRGYFAIRQRQDADYAEEVTSEADAAGTSSVSAHPRYQSMALAAHGVAAAANVGKVMITRHPLAINYAQWLAFTRAFFGWTQSKQPSFTDGLVAQADVNASALAAGWPPIDATDPSFPTLHP